MLLCNLLYQKVCSIISPFLFFLTQTTHHSPVSLVYHSHPAPSARPLPPPRGLLLLYLTAAGIVSASSFREHNAALYTSYDPIATAGMSPLGRHTCLLGWLYLPSGLLTETKNREPEVCIRYVQPPTIHFLFPSFLQITPLRIHNSHLSLLLRKFKTR